MMKSLLGLIVALQVMISVNAQDESQRKEFSNTMYFSPVKLLRNTLQVDFEYDIRNTRSQLMVSPMFTYGMIRERQWFDNEPKWPVAGVGVELLHRLYVLPNDKVINYYFAHGPMIQYMNVKYDGMSWVEKELNGDEVLFLEDVESKMSIKKYGYSLHIGMKFLVGKYLVFDTFMGLGFRFSDIDPGIGGEPELTRRPSGYGYTGNVFTTGARIGLILF